MNNGNSGGPVIDIKTGKVVGVAKTKLARMSPYLEKIKDGEYKRGVGIGGGDFDLQKFVVDIANVMDENVQMGVGLAISSEYAEAALASQQAKKP